MQSREEKRPLVTRMIVRSYSARREWRVRTYASLQIRKAVMLINLPLDVETVVRIDGRWRWSEMFKMEEGRGFENLLAGIDDAWTVESILLPSSQTTMEWIYLTRDTTASPTIISSYSSLRSHTEPIIRGRILSTKIFLTDRCNFQTPLF